jgi:hypothetical protein
MFIAFLKRYRAKWNEPAVQEELAQHGITAAAFPDTSNLRSAPH